MYLGKKRREKKPELTGWAARDLRVAGWSEEEEKLTSTVSFAPGGNKKKPHRGRDGRGKRGRRRWGRGIKWKTKEQGRERGSIRKKKIPLLTKKSLILLFSLRFYIPRTFRNAFLAIWFTWKTNSLNQNKLNCMISWWSRVVDMHVHTICYRHTFLSDRKLSKSKKRRADRPTDRKNVDFLRAFDIASPHST